MKQLDNVSDIDITSGDKSIGYTSQEFGIKLAKKYNIVRRTFDDGHSAIHIGDFKMDFSSNFNVDGIEAMLQKIGIKNPTEMQKEMFSRDFTCNALLLSLDLKSVTDPTGRGLKDINEKVIRTCLAPEITLVTNKNRVVRAIYLASKLDFDIDPKIVEFVKANPTSTKISTEKVTIEKLNEAFAKNPDRASYYITKMGIWDQIPITEAAQPYYKRQSLTSKKAYFQGGGGVNEPTPKKKKYKSEPALVHQPRFEEPLYYNYDLYDTPGKHSPGAGYNSMHKYKSMKEFIEAKRKKMKDKYEADDSWILDDGSITKKNPNIKTRAALLEKIIKAGSNDENSIDFPIDDQIKSTIDHDADLSHHSLEMGGMGFPGVPDDFEGKSPSALNYGRDYVEDEVPTDKKDLESLIEKYLNHETKTEFLGLPDGFNHSEEEDTLVDTKNPDYGTLGPDSLMYEDKWNI